MNIGRVSNKSKSLPYCLPHPSRHMRFSSYKFVHSAKPKQFDKALKILNIISPKTPTTPSVDRPSHLRLIQDFLRTNSNQDSTQSNSIKRIPNVINQLLEATSVNDPDSDSDSDTTRFNFDASSLSSGVSSCTSLLDLRGGIQYHCLGLTSGFLASAYVGSSLITFYGRCGRLGDAYKLFDEMPVRNVVTWTAIISGFAQESQIDVCLELFSVMRNSTLKPNDFTFTSLLSSCTGMGALGHGRSAHCQIFQMGFQSYLHIANSLISMYSKCGSVEDALYIFENMRNKDVVSWNSMISGYAHHGLALEAIELFEKMKEVGIKPDSFTFLGVLSSCRHAGLVERGKNYFNTMVEYGVVQQLDHYSCLVDLLGRAGFIEDALHVIFKMPRSPNAVIWGSLLSSCRLHGRVWIGIQAAESRLLLEPDCAATHVQLANLYSSVKCWDEAARVRKLMKDGEVKTYPGFSWIEIKNKAYKFRAEDSSNSRLREIVTVLDYLGNHMIMEEEVTAFQVS
ncbi:pentatricopeptide repeat-containing protein At2g37320 [Euphorbia lathyris]|uniref:pentatricopeptide repeat-containing protein At2g37320 n=1 Tax=Euphorbia lathyris TaxID=212925 RepID=UPI003313A58B